MSIAKTDRRVKKITAVATARQKGLTVVLENIHDPHNVSAIFRTCDATGVPLVHLIYTTNIFPKIGKKSSASAFKWVSREKHKDVKSCYAALREQNFKIYASTLAEDAKDLYSLDLTGPTAIVLGNEHEGVTKEAAEEADERFLIPMKGMVQSLNVSVANSVILYEALRQRNEKGMYDSSEYSEEDLKLMIEDWCNR